jgi:glycosyltransferase involved in cell wall biosynthesis
MVSIEAMAAKKPVIATCFGGAREVVEDGKTGYIVNPYNTAEFVKCLKDILLDRQLQADFGQAGFLRVKEKFDIHFQIQAYEDLYRK